MFAGRPAVVSIEARDGVLTTLSFCHLVVGVTDMDRA